MNPLATALLAELRRGDLAAAYALGVQALSLPDVDRGRTHLVLGQIELQRGHSDTARVHLEQAVAAAVATPDAARMLSRLLSEEDPQRSLSLLLQAAAHPDAGGDVALELAATLAGDHGRPGDALAWYDAAALVPAWQAPAWSGQCVAAAAIGDEVLAGKAAAQLLAIKAEQPAALLAPMAEALLGLTHPPAEAETVLDRLALVAGPSPRLALMRSHLAVLRRQPEQAAEHARAALELAPGDAEARRLLAECLLLSGQVQEAARWIAELVQDGAAFPGTVLALADALRQRQDTAAALGHVEALVRTQPHHVGALIELSRLQADAGRDDEARTTLVRAMALDPEVDQEAGRAGQLFRQVLAEVPQLLARLGRSPAGAVIRRTRMGHNALLVQVARANGEELYVKVMLPGRRSDAHVEATAALEAALATTCELPVPLPLADADGARMFACAGGQATVLAAIPGVSLRRTLADPRALVTPAHAASLGRCLATLQPAFRDVVDWQRPTAPGMTGGLSALRDWQGNPDGWRREAMALGLTGRHDTLVDAVARHVDRWLPAAFSALAAAPAGIVHGDFGWHNVTWDGDRVAGVVDFDYAAVDAPLADLANAVHRTAVDWRRLLVRTDPRPRSDIASALVQAFVSEAGRLPLEDRHALDAVLIAARVAYYVSMARAGGLEDARSPAGYGQAAAAIELLRGQLDWLGAGGCAELLPDADLRRCF